MSDLSNLIERLSKAKGQDRALDIMIAEAIGHKTYHGTTPVIAAAPAYTASLDAAVALVPEGWVWGIAENDKADILSGGGFQAFVRAQLDGSGDFCAANYQHTEHKCASIALCTAALKAREAKG